MERAPDHPRGTTASRALRSAHDPEVLRRIRAGEEAIRAGTEPSAPADSRAILEEAIEQIREQLRSAADA